MKRYWSVLLSILLGALVVGLGTGYFLYLANKDRTALAQEALQAKQQMQQALEESQRAINEANQKLRQANQEVDKAHAALEALEQERALIIQATPLVSPPAKDVLGWHSVISEPFGFAIQYPPNSSVIQNDARALSIASKPDDAGTPAATPWFLAVPYSAAADQQFRAQIGSSTAVTYLIEGRILSGVLGDSANQEQAAVFQLIENGTSTHLLWIQEPPEYKEEFRKKPIAFSFQDAISTLKFK